MPVKSLVSAVFATLVSICTVAQAADYYLVVPVPNRTPPRTIAVALGSYGLPAGTVGTPYPGFNLASVLSVTGDSNFNGSGVQFAVTGGSLPAGLVLDSATGAISGTPSASTADTGQVFQVSATYKAKSGSQSYQVAVSARVDISIASATLAAASGAAFSYNLKGLVSVQTENYADSKLSLSLTGAPSGFSFNNTTGLLSGSSTQVGTYPLKLVASYGPQSAQKDFTLAVTGTPHSCAEYLANNPGASSGWYTLDADGTGPSPAQSYFCDMVSDGGGWTRVVRQTEANPVTNWNGGVNGSSYALASPSIPAHKQVAFGKDELATAVDYVTWAYSTGDIGLTTLTSSKTGVSYQISRSKTGFYNGLDPESGAILVDPAGTNIFSNSLTFNKVSGSSATDFTWAFAPQAPANLRGYALNGSYGGTADSFAWTVWVR